MKSFGYFHSLTLDRVIAPANTAAGFRLEQPRFQPPCSTLSSLHSGGGSLELGLHDLALCRSAPELQGITIAESPDGMVDHIMVAAGAALVATIPSPWLPLLPNLASRLLL